MPVIWHAKTYKGKGSAWVAVTTNSASHSTRHVNASQYSTRHNYPSPTIKTKKGIWGSGIPWSTRPILAHRPPHPKAHGIAHKPRKPLLLPNHRCLLESARNGYADAVGAIFEDMFFKDVPDRSPVKTIDRLTADIQTGKT